MMSEPSNSSLELFDCGGISGPSGSALTVLVTISYVVLIPFIVVGNGLVVTAFIINQKLRTATNIFICGLGLSDLLIGVFSVPYWTYISSLNSLLHAFCTPLYQVFICVDIGTGCASILQLTSIAIERLYFTIAPLKHRQLRRSVYWYMLAIAWVFSIFVGGLHPLQAKRNWYDEYSVFLLVSCFLCPLSIIIAVYSYIFKVSRNQSRRRSSTRDRIGSTGGNIKEFNMFVTVIVITGVFVIAWTPFFLTTVIANFCPTCIGRTQSDNLVRFVKWMQYSSSAINPYIYAYRKEEVRCFFKKILCGICLCNGCRGVFRLKSQNASSETPRLQGSRNNNTESISKQSTHELGIENDVILHRLPKDINSKHIPANDRNPSLSDSKDTQLQGIEPCFFSQGFSYRKERLDEKGCVTKVGDSRRVNESGIHNHRSRSTLSQQRHMEGKLERENERNMNKRGINDPLTPAPSLTGQREKHERTQQGRMSNNRSERDYGERNQFVGRHCDQILSKHSYQNHRNVKRSYPNIRSFDKEIGITNEMLNSTYV